jgi:hypothetical protein
MRRLHLTVRSDRSNALFDYSTNLKITTSNTWVAETALTNVGMRVL